MPLPEWRGINATGSCVLSSGPPSDVLQYYYQCVLHELRSNNVRANTQMNPANMTQYVNCRTTFKFHVCLVSFRLNFNRMYPNVDAPPSAIILSTNPISTWPESLIPRPRLYHRFSSRPPEPQPWLVRSLPGRELLPVQAYFVLSESSSSGRIPFLALECSDLPLLFPIMICFSFSGNRVSTCAIREFHQVITQQKPRQNFQGRGGITRRAKKIHHRNT